MRLIQLMGIRLSKKALLFPSIAGEAFAKVIWGWERSISGVFFVELILLIYACTSTWKHPAVPGGTDELWNERSFSSFFLSRSLSPSDSLLCSFYLFFSFSLSLQMNGKVTKVFIPNAIALYWTWRIDRVVSIPLINSWSVWKTTEDSNEIVSNPISCKKQLMNYASRYARPPY